MIPLTIQIHLIIYSFLFGIFFFAMYLLWNRFIYCHNIYFRILNTFSFIMLHTLLYFLGIEKISDGILHIYSLMIVAIGFLVGEFIARKMKK